MDVVGPLWGGLEILMHETALFAASGFLILGLGDLAIDGIWMAASAAGTARPRRLEDIPSAGRPGAMAVFIPAWDEGAVIGAMLRCTLRAYGAADYRLYVGAYPNDPATLAAVAAVADPRIRLVVGCSPGPTTKADCLNRLWRALIADEAAGAPPAKAVVLHDAEDVVHPAELGLFGALIGRFDLVQLPVVPLIDEGSRWIGGHYADEFAEAHGKELVVRAALGAALPSAGVGCALSRTALDRLASSGGGLPFDADSVTEDYEIGLRICEGGGRAAFVRHRGSDGQLVATREYFPGTLAAAVRQKSRWMTGIALSGWDRLGWSGGLAERWMRLRDRQALMAALMLVAGYGATLLWLLLKLREGFGGPAPAAMPPFLTGLLRLNLILLSWRLLVRFAFTARTYGLREGLRAVPRAFVGNLIAILAAASALRRYHRHRRTGSLAWDKTDHRFPAEAAAE